MEKSIYIRLKKKTVKKTTLFFNIYFKILPFLKEKDDIIFYIKIKEVVGKGEYEEFYEYFESTWLSIEDKKNCKFEFKFWSYSAYLNKKKSLTDEKASVKVPIHL